MKYFLAVIFLIVAANQANADGFYQLVTADRPAAETGVPGFISGLAPLHEQVLKGSRSVAERETASRVSEWTYTPLYLRVTAQLQHFIDDEHIVVGGNGDHAGS